MIKSCEEVKTIDNFDELVLFRSKTVRIGLRETAEMLCWNKKYIICPGLVEILYGRRPLRIAND